jgi:hypothetical protein
MSARRLNAMRRRPEHGHENGDRGTGAHRPATNAHVFSRDGEWNSHHPSSVTGNPVTGGVEREDLDVYEVRHDERAQGSGLRAVSGLRTCPALRPEA